MEVRDWKTWLTVFVSASVLGPANSIAHAGCVELVAGDVLIVPHGYLIQSRNQFVLYDDALRSGDDKYWFCTTDAGRDLALYVPEDVFLVALPTAARPGKPQASGSEAGGLKENAATGLAVQCL